MSSINESEAWQDQMYAIINKRTGKFLYGTDRRYYPYHQRTSEHWSLTYPCYAMVETDFKARKCGKDYKIVEVELEVKEG